MDELTAGEPGDPYARPSLDDPFVQDLLERLCVAAASDLGGTMSLNVHLEEPGLVLRVHARFEQAARVRALRGLRRRLDARGLVVGVPQPLLGEETLSIEGCIAEAETFVDAKKPDPTWGAYVWMYEAMGRLHRTLQGGAADLDLPVLPAPGVATYAVPADLRRWISTTSAAVSRDEHAARVATQVSEMIDHLERRWIAPERLPQQLVHGDIRLDNVTETPVGDAAYFDFGFAARRPRIHELAYALFWIVLEPDGSGRAEHFDWHRVADLIEAYEVAAGVRLEDVERRALGPSLAAVPMYLASIAGFTPDPCDRIKQEIRSLEIARWVLDHSDELLA